MTYSKREKHANYETFLERNEQESFIKEFWLFAKVKKLNLGTWERLADVVYKGGAKSLKAKGIQAVGTEKTSWAKNIGNYLEVTKNKSPSFMFFVNCIREYLKVGMA